jgi:PadR family transcriptional regulator PadR
MEPGSAVSQLRRGVLEYCVLALLRDEPRYAFDLVSELGRHTALVTSEGTIYPLLARLRRDHLVTTEERESPAAPPRRYYALTTQGRRALDRFAGDWTDFRTAVDALINHGGTGALHDRRPQSN